MAAGHVIDALTKVIKEDLSPGIRDALVELEPTFKYLTTTSMNVVRGQGLGRDWKIIHTFITSLAGRIKATGKYSETGAIYDTDEPYTVHGTMRAYPSISAMVTPGYMQRTIEMQEWQGTMGMPVQFMRADALTASLGSAVAATIKQTARNVALQKANMFFTTDPTLKPIGVISSVTAGGADTHNYVTFVIDTAYGSIRNFAPGMEIDIWDTTGAAQHNVITAGTAFQLVVYSVDPILNQVKAVAGDATAVFETDTRVVATDIVTLRDSKSYGPSGIESWLQGAGATVYGIAFDTHPQFKSISAAIGGYLTDAVLTKYLGGFIKGHGAFMAPDTLLTSQGVLNGYVDQVDSMRQWQVQGTAQDVVGGYQEGVKFNFNGRIMRFLISDMIAAGRLYGVKLGGDNIRRYVPPKLNSVGTQVGFDDVDFMAPLGGSNGIWKHAHNGDGATTEYLEAPFDIIEEYCPEIIPGIKFTTLTEVLATV